MRRGGGRGAGMNIRERASEAMFGRDGLSRACRKYPDAVIENAIWSQCDRDAATICINQLPRILSESDIVLWSLDLYNAAVRGAPEAFEGQPIPVTMFDLQKPQLWYLTDGVIGVPSPPDYWEIPKTAHCDCLLLTPVRFEPTPETSALLGALVFIDAMDGAPYIRVTGSMVKGEIVLGSQMVFVCMSEFMKLTLTAREPIRLPRPEQRRRERQREYIPSINVIQLRRRASSGSHGVSEREYHHQWIVKGHWRRLHAPRKKDGKEVTYVSPYVKGPDGKPLLPPRQTVYAVTR
jgi:hypothetical protein